MRTMLLLCALLVGGQLGALNLDAHLLENETTISEYFKIFKEVPLCCPYRNVDCIYVINLDERPEKWQDTLECLSPYEMPLNRFSGVNGWTVPQEVWETFWIEQGLDPKSPPIGRGKLGCILSHLSVLQDAYDRGFQRIWILQDDLQVYDDPTFIDGYIDRLNAIDPNWGLLFTDLDMVHPENPQETLRALCITGSFRANQETMPEPWYLVRENIDEDFQLIRSRYGFHSVLVSRRGMEAILEYFKLVTLHTSFDIDIQYIHTMPKYGLRKPLIRNAPFAISDNANKTILKEHSQLLHPEGSSLNGDVENRSPYRNDVK
jgi:GR25 family glycosyltransferase involved in LPS biosynthesis